MLSGSIVLKGFLLSGSLIMAIGAQNAFVLKQGIRRQGVFLVASICFVSESLLMVAGALGVGTLVRQSPTLLALAAWGGALFLFLYGARSFRSAWRQDAGLSPADPVRGDGLGAIALVALAVTYLNPHVYLDTVVLVGSIAGQFAFPDRISFIVGALLASLTWFYGLAFGARLLAPWLASPRAWRVLDALIGVVMWAIALSLVRMALAA